MADNQPLANRGLSISPIRHFISVKAGSSKTDTIVIGNYTDHDATVSLSVKQFSVANYSYIYEFGEVAGAKLITLDVNQATLKPNQTKAITFKTTVPTGSTPGGRYYTVFATTTIRNSSVQQQVQAASVVYVTVEGNLVRTNNLGAHSMQRFVHGNRVPFSMDISNTGNTHYVVYVNASLHGLLTSKSNTSENHLLLPIKTRHINSSLPSPTIPGIYKASYGYRTEYGSAVEQTAYVVYAPPWSVAILILVVWLSIKLLLRFRRKTAPQSQEKTMD